MSNISDILSILDFFQQRRNEWINKTDLVNRFVDQKKMKPETLDYILNVLHKDLKVVLMPAYKFIGLQEIYLKGKEIDMILEVNSIKTMTRQQIADNWPFKVCTEVNRILDEVASMSLEFAKTETLRAILGLYHVIDQSSMSDSEKEEAKIELEDDMFTALARRIKKYGIPLPEWLSGEERREMK